MGKSKSSGQGLIIGLFVAAVILGVLLVAGDWDEIRAVAGQAAWEPVLMALLFTGISYACISYSFARVCRMLNFDMGTGELTRVGYISTVFNHFVTSGGLAGISVRYAFMRPHKITMKDVMTASILHFYLTSLFMLSMLPVGIVYLLANVDLPRGLAAVMAAVVFLLLIVLVVATSFIFVSATRGRLLKFGARVVRLITRRDLEPTFMAFDETMTRGVIAIRQRPAALVLILLLIMVDWMTSAISLGFCFDAFGLPVSPGVLMSAFVIGIMAGVLSLIPGGLGVQEGSMAGVFTLLGSSYEQAVLASILFRVTYFLIPFVVSLVIYYFSIRRLRKKPTSTQKEVSDAHPDVEPWLSSDGERRDAGYPEARPGYGEEGSPSHGTHGQRSRSGLS